MLKTKITYYYFDISNNEELRIYRDLKRTLKKDRVLFDCISLNSYEEKKAYFQKIKDLEKKGVVELETKFIFNNQWNTSATSGNLRIMDWREEIYPNENIKEGYYLEITPAMRDIRNNTFKCGYCGKHYNKPNKVFCTSCLDSEYLGKKQIFLLRLKAVSDNSERTHLTVEEETELIPLYTKAQIEGSSERGKKRIKAKRARLLKERDQTLINAKKEYNGFIWLLDRGINTENCIYYTHSGLFCFGWRNKLSFEVEQDLKGKLKDFPYKYELRVQNGGRLK